MTALIILGIIAIIITIIMLIPIGADIAYEGGQLRISAKAAGKLIQLIPRPPQDDSKPKEEKKPEKEKKSEPKPEEKEKKPKKKLELDFSVDEIMELLKKVLKGFGVLGRKFRVDRFLLDYLAAGRDPYLTARVFGIVNASLNTLAPICSQRFDVDDLYVRTDIDFTAEHMKLDFGLALSIRIGAIFRMINTILFGALGILIKHKLRKQIEKKTGGQDGNEEQIPPETEKENMEINIQQEERKDEENGK